MRNGFRSHISFADIACVKIILSDRPPGAILSQANKCVCMYVCMYVCVKGIHSVHDLGKVYLL